MRALGMKKLGLYALALLLIAGTTAALSDDRHRGDRHERPHWNHFKQHHYTKPHRPYFRYRYRGPWSYRSYRPGYYHLPPAGVLIGSTITFSPYHTHDGAYCYDDHRRRGDRYGGGNRHELAGCHRIERLRDGTERRIEVPLSECR